MINKKTYEFLLTSAEKKMLEMDDECHRVKAERDAWKESAEDQVAKLIEIANHRDMLKVAAKLAWVAILELRHSNSTDKSRSVSEFAIQALREAGVK